MKGCGLKGLLNYILTILCVVLALLPALARLCGKCLTFSGKILIFIHILMLVFGLVFVALGFTMFFGDPCKIGHSASDTAGVSFGPCAALALVAELVAIVATFFSRKYFSGEAAAAGTYQAY